MTHSEAFDDAQVFKSDRSDLLGRFDSDRSSKIVYAAEINISHVIGIVVVLDLIPQRRVSGSHQVCLKGCKYLSSSPFNAINLENLAFLYFDHGGDVRTG